MMAWYSPKPKRAILLLFFVLTNIKHMEQIKKDLILLIAQITDAELPDLDNISEAIEQIFNQ